MERRFDVAVIGGGINGCGIARDAAGRGLSVYLCEQNDLASGTSSWSTKLIHGGLRYLEHYEFRLVRESLMEREVLWRLAPHIIWPLRFVLPHHGGLRPAWLLRLGLFLYDHLGGRKLLPPTRTLDLRRDPAGEPLRQGYTTAFEYSDCWVQDARLVVLNAMDARERGATIETRRKLVAARRELSGWKLTIEDTKTSRQSSVSSSVLVNAAGPWVGDALSRTGTVKTETKIRLVRGSHIVVRKLYEHDRSYIFQNADGRIIFAIPYEHDFTLIGTTDVDYMGDPADVVATPADVSYLCAAASEYFRQPVSESDIVWTYAGVRPLYDDGTTKAQDATREYVLRLDDEGGAPLLSVFGGKITTYRRLAEAALQTLAPHLPEAARAKAGWTATERLPGGDFEPRGFPDLLASLRGRYPFLGEPHLKRLARSYGTRVARLVGDARSLSDMGRRFGNDLTEREIRYLIKEEWAETLDDIIWRRSKLGLHLSDEDRAAVAAYVDEATGRAPRSLARMEAGQ